MSELSTGIGETLRDARRRQSHSLADVAASTKVRESHLAALETEDFEALGGDVYVRGFITAYARYLGLDPQPLLDAHRAHRDRRPGGQARSERAAEPKVRVRSGRVVILLLLVLLVVLGIVLAGFWGDAEAGARLVGSW